MENNKIFDLLDKAIQMLDRCWEGYKPVAGVKPYEEGSCEKEMATQSDMGEIEEVISMLDKAIKFYDPSQTRDESGKWSGSGGGSGKIGDPSNDDPYLGGGIPELLASAEKRLKVLKDKGEGYKAAVLEGQIDVLKSINEKIKNKEKGYFNEFYDPSQERDSSGKWTGGGGGSSSGNNAPKDKGIITTNPPSEIPDKKINPMVASEIVGDKLDEFFEENGSGIDDEFRESPIKAFVKAAEGWMGSNEPDKYDEKAVKKGINRILRVVDAVGEVYGDRKGTFGGSFAKLGAFLEKLSDSQGWSAHSKNPDSLINTIDKEK
jgi:hypothetical protein